MIFQTAIIENQGLHYRIQRREVPGGWEQRHIWFAPTPHVDGERVDPWIWSGRLPCGPTYSPVEG